MLDKFINSLLNFNFKQKAALCSVLISKGSTPRKDFPQMLVLENGVIIGTIGGGELENRVIKKAIETIEKNIVQLEYFDMTSSVVTSSNSICGGKVIVLIEPFIPGIQQLFTEIYSNVSSFPLLILTDVQLKEEMQVERKVLLSKNTDNEDFSNINKLIQRTWSSKKSEALQQTDRITLVSYITESSVLYIFGAGHVSKSVAELANILDINVKVCDDRAELANKNRFPFAMAIHTDEIKSLQSKIQFTPSDFVLITTRDHLRDYEVLDWVLKKKIAYIGMVASKRKWELIAKRLLDEGHSKESIQKVHAPVGLQIGAETVPEIAVSIVAEMIRVKKSRSNLS